jgi:hypothetical protein
MSDLFREVLLGTSRVIWPAGPRVLTLPGRSPAALAREYLAIASGAYDRTTWHGALTSLERLVAAFLDPKDRPMELRHLPRARHIERANRVLARRLDRAADLARRLVDHDGDVVAMTRDIAARRSPRPGWKRMSARDVFRHEVRPFLPTAHLLLPLVARRMQEFVERYPELAPSAIPLGLIGVIRTDDWPYKRLDGLLFNDRWVFAALDAAERWRELAARRSAFLAEVLVQVLANLHD